MSADDCRDKVRYSLSDKSGTLRFEAFDIVDAPDCQDTADEMRRVLLGRPLAEIDVASLLGICCPANGQCMRAVADVIAEAQILLGGNKG